MQGGPINNSQQVITDFRREEVEKLAAETAKRLGLPYFDIRNQDFQPDVLSLISEEEARRGILPIEKKDKELVLGVTDPKSEQAKATVAELSSYFNKITLFFITWEGLKDVLPRYKGLNKQSLGKRERYEIDASSGVVTFSDLDAKINSAPIQDILSYIVTVAIQSKSSDIHLEPQKDSAQIRFRIDGVLHIVAHLNEERFKYVLSQVELSSGLKLNVNEAQQGRLEVRGLGQNISIRVETMPSLYGDDISLRIFNTEATALSLDDLGFYDYSRSALDEALSRPQGMILVVGPTGAGKSSTIYAALNTLNHPEVKIVTLEDPIEYALSGIIQSQINEGESFATRLKAVLREDPDIVMVGEIRDEETAEVALHAALTGHVMVSTFHANNAVTAIGLLKEIASNSSLLAAAINIIIGQRLVRKLCEGCRIKHLPTEKEKAFINRVWGEAPASLKGSRELNFYESKGCEKCGGLGFRGRVGIFELLGLNLELQKMIAREDVTIIELQEAARKSGMITMEEDGLLKAIDGVTSISEVMKVVKE